MNEFLIVIPCHNAALYVTETINSVKCQSHQNWKCVIVDDASTDGSWDIIQRETRDDARFVTLRNEKNMGVAYSRNRGISFSSGEYVIALDADDYLEPNALEVFSKTWAANGRASLLVPQIRRFGDHIVSSVQERRWTGYDGLKQRCTPTNSSCFRYEDWKRVGGYRICTMYEDWEFWLRLLHNNDRVVNIPKVLVNYRVHGDSRWHQAVGHHKREVDIIRQLNPRIFGRTGVLVVIPFWAKGAQGNELELAVTGWREFFKEPYHIVVVGDKHPILEDKACDISYLPCEQVKPIPGQYLPHIDHVHKFREVYKAFPGTEGFVYTCDDIYPAADIDMADIIQPKHPERGFMFTINPNWRKMPVDWYSDKHKTGVLCVNEGLEPRNWVCHLPVHYQWEALLSLYDKYNCDERSYIVENIYFNQMYRDDPHALNCDLYHDEVKMAVPDLRPIGSRKWISNANCGWSEKLENILRKHYGL